MIFYYVKKFAFLISCLILCGSTVYASEQDWTLLKIDGSYAYVNEMDGVYITVSRVSYKDAKEEIIHMAKYNQCDVPEFSKDLNSFMVKNCLLGKDLKQNVYGRLSDFQDPNNENIKYYNQTYLVAKDPSVDKYQSVVLDFIDKNYLDNPYKGWITNRVSSDPTTWFEENAELRAIISVRESSFPNDVAKEDMIKDLTSSLLCSKNTKKSETEYFLDDCKTFNVFTLRFIGKNEYLIVGVNSEMKDNLGVKTKINEIIDRVKIKHLNPSNS